MHVCRGERGQGGRGGVRLTDASLSVCAGSH